MSFEEDRTSAEMLLSELSAQVTTLKHRIEDYEYALDLDETVRYYTAFCELTTEERENYLVVLNTAIDDLSKIAL